MVTVIFMIGAVDIASYQSNRPAPSRQSVSVVAAGQQFIAYRNAIDDYVAKNPSFTGSVTPQMITLPYGFNLPFATGNQVVKTPSGNGQIAVVWANLPQGALFSSAVGIRGDMSLGLVGASGQWVSPIASSVSPIPAGISIPSGYSVSVVQIGM
jgi:hypothetical protein